MIHTAVVRSTPTFLFLFLLSLLAGLCSTIMIVSSWYPPTNIHPPSSETPLRYLDDKDTDRQKHYADLLATLFTKVSYLPFITNPRP